MWSVVNKFNKEKVNQKIIILFEVMLIIISLLSIMPIIKKYEIDYKYNYSSSKELANYINQNIEEEAIFISCYDAEISATIAYTNDKMKFWNVRTEEYYTYITWDWRREMDITVGEIEQKLNENFSNQDNLYYIACVTREDNMIQYLYSKNKVEELYTTSGSLTDEMFVLYKINLRDE